VTLPNAITIARLALVPFLVALTYGRSPLTVAAALALFLLATISDWLDGCLARRLNARSRFGTLVDPLVDKVLILSVLFVFADLELLPMWLVLLAMFREFVVSAVRHAASGEGRVVGANWMGKAKFVGQSALVCLGYAILIATSAGREPGHAPAVLFWSFLALTAMSLVSLARFAAHNWPEIAGAEPREPPEAR
jgi:CDP-diacylglycerol--glycerol-3-phosphate 3-phosphatidyltransferase